MLALMYFFIIAILLVQAKESSHSEKNAIPQVTFKDYIRKFRPTEIWNDIENDNKRKGLNRSLKDEFTTMYNRLDETDELLNLTVKNGDPKMVLYKDGRRWKPPGDIVWDDPNAYDPFSIRRRLLELMKQAIYQTRNKMVFMQLMKEKYDKKTLYKMGFLMSKTDTTCSIFASFAFKAYKKCSMSRQAAIFSYPIIDKLDATERLLNLWFDVDLLIDLIMANHKMCTLMLQNANATRKEAWKFID